MRPEPATSGQNSLSGQEEVCKSVGGMFHLACIASTSFSTASGRGSAARLADAFGYPDRHETQVREYLDPAAGARAFGLTFERPCRIRVAGLSGTGDLRCPGQDRGGGGAAEQHRGAARAEPEPHPCPCRIDGCGVWQAFRQKQGIPAHDGACFVGHAAPCRLLPPLRQPPHAGWRQARGLGHLWGPSGPHQAAPSRTRISGGSGFVTGAAPHIPAFSANQTLNRRGIPWAIHEGTTVPWPMVRAVIAVLRGAIAAARS